MCILRGAATHLKTLHRVNPKSFSKLHKTPNLVKPAYPQTVKELLNLRLYPAQLSSAGLLAQTAGKSMGIRLPYFCPPDEVARRPMDYRQRGETRKHGYFWREYRHPDHLGESSSLVQPKHINNEEMDEAVEVVGNCEFQITSTGH